MCQIADASRSGYYEWLKQYGRLDSDYGDYLFIKEIFDKGKQKYGWRQVKMQLERQKGVVMNHKKIIRIKNKYGLITK